MKKLIAALFATIAFTSAYAADNCEAMAAEKKLAGAAKTSFMKKCEADAAAGGAADVEGRRGQRLQRRDVVVDLDPRRVQIEAQIAAGCHAAQIFESWLGELDREDLEEFAFPYLARIAEAVSSTSCPSKSPVILVSPTAIAPKISERCEIDLSPGTEAMPFKGPHLAEVIGCASPWPDMGKLRSGLHA